MKKVQLWAKAVCLLIGFVLSAVATAIPGMGLPFWLVLVLVTPLVWMLLTPWFVVHEDWFRVDDDPEDHSDS